MELMSPDELERVLDAAPIAFVPVGTFEHHGWHLQVCFDGIKAQALCERVAERTGGTVLPTNQTSIALALNPDWVRLGQLTAGHDPARVTLPETPRKDASTHDPTHPLYAIHGQDPRERASRELGEKLVNEIITRLAEKVIEALGQAAKPPNR